MLKFKVVLIYYQSYFLLTIAISLAACTTHWQLVAFMMLIKAITSFLIGFYLLFYVQVERFFFYENLGISRKKLVLLSLLFDYLIFCILLMIPFLWK